MHAGSTPPTQIGMNRIGMNREGRPDVGTCTATLVTTQNRPVAKLTEHSMRYGSAKSDWGMLKKSTAK
jgi:hypothetical protein